MGGIWSSEIVGSTGSCGRTKIYFNVFVLCIWDENLQTHQIADFSEAVTIILIYLDS